MGVHGAALIMCHCDNQGLLLQTFSASYKNECGNLALLIFFLPKLSHNSGIVERKKPQYAAALLWSKQ